jgi:CDP-6-deoxy-D-xylo-4-hexulose-3-dehydrase
MSDMTQTNETATADALRRQILDLVVQYHDAKFAAREFRPGESPVPVAGRVFDAAEIVELVDSSLDFWLTTGRFADQFEREFARWIGIRHALLCNSGSSANLLALSALTSESLGPRRLKPGDEVITAAAGFPTTVNPTIQNGLTPVFVDVELGTYNADVNRVEEAIGPKTRAIMLAHTLGNPFDLGAIADLAARHDLWLVEDNCDALGSTYDGRLTGTFGDLATFSFYPAHHLTMGEGGCVATGNSRLKTLVESFRDWGRACWCAPGADNTCGKRFDWQLGELPAGYDHKYIYSHIGYNLKATDMQAAVGVAQLKKLPGFIAARKQNWQRLYERLTPWEEHLILPRATPRSDPSWFGFPITVKQDAPFARLELVRFLESRRIGTRQLFGGNLTRQPAYRNVPFRLVGSLANADFAMRNTFWIGVYPGLSEAMIDYIGESFTDFMQAVSRAPLRMAS